MPRRNINGAAGSSNLLKPKKRNPNGTTTTTTTATTATTKSSKITIRPYSKPPALPVDYYDKTVTQLLQGTLQSLQQQLQTAPLSNNTKNAVYTNLLSSPVKQQQQQQQQQSSSSPLSSLQTSYTAVVTLVRHQYGPKLYADWIQSLQQAVETVLPDHLFLGTAAAAAAAAGSSAIPTGNSNHHHHHILLQSIPRLYQVFIDYLLVCKHVFLALDRTHVWNAVEQKAIATTTTTATSSSSATAAAGSANVHHQTMWTAGLAHFRARMAKLSLESALYQEWLHALLQDWHGSTLSSSSTSSSSSVMAATTAAATTTATTTSSRSHLQAVWYMWQDLGLVGSINSPLPLQQDLEEHWRQTGQDQWEQALSNTGSGSSAAAAAAATSTDNMPAAAVFLDLCVQQHDHVTHWRPWLPVPWLWHILDIHVLQPVLHDKEDGLLHPRQLHPLLEQQVFRHASVSAFGIQSSKLMTSSAGASSAVNPHLIHHHHHQYQYQHQRLTPVQQLWMLAGRLPGGQQDVAAAICTFAKTQGLQRLQQGNITSSSSAAAAAAAPSNNSSSSNNTQAVSDLLHLQECLTAMVNSLQPGGPDLISFKSVWEEVVNTGSSLAEPLAKFLDQILRSHKKMDLYANRSTAVGAMTTTTTTTTMALTAASASQVASQQRQDEWLQRIISGLFVPLQAKDVFEAFYKRDLAKRLLWNRIVSMDVEKQVCSLLKAECGAGYTSKMEGMFQDIDLSRESMLVYKQALAAEPQKPNGVEMEVQILTTGYWPVYPQYPNLHLPLQLSQLQEHFDAHYKKKCQGRRTTWQYALGHCIVRTNGFSKAYELVVSLCQALVLVQFTTTDTKWTLPALMQAVGLEDRDEMERILQSLALGKEGTRILRKLDFDTEAGKKKKIRMNVDDRDQFVIQQSFTSNQRRIRITNIMMKETKEEREKTVEAVSRDRLYLIDAALVRIMKARKTIMHQSLIPQVLEQLKFPAQPSDVKKRIESLIEREYMERDAKDRNRYNYLA